MDKKSGTGRKATMTKRPSTTRKPSASEGGMDLSALFGVAAQALAANQQSLNRAGAQNGNHGDNMVQMFNMLTQVTGQQKGSSPSQQLNHASQHLSQHGTSGSSKVYAQGLAQAAQQLQGQKSLNQDNAMVLVQSLLGGGQAPARQGGGADLLGSLLGAVTQTQQPQQKQNDGIDMGDLLNAGMAFMNAKNQGQDNLQAGLSALMSAGPLGQSSHRQQSGQLVGNALLQAIAGMAKGR